MFGWISRKWHDRLLSQQVRLCADIIEMLDDVRPVFEASCVRGELTAEHAAILGRFIDDADHLSKNGWLQGMAGHLAPPDNLRAILLRHRQLRRLRGDLRTRRSIVTT